MSVLGFARRSSRKQARSPSALPGLRILWPLLMEMSDTYLVIQTLGFATGSVLNGLLLILVWRAERLAGKTRRGTWVTALVLLWNAGSLVTYAALLLGFKLVLPFANAVASVSASLYCPVFTIMSA